MLNADWIVHKGLSSFKSLLYCLKARISLIYEAILKNPGSSEKFIILFKARNFLIYKAIKKSCKINRFTDLKGL